MAEDAFPAPVIAGAVAAARSLLRMQGTEEEAVLAGMAATALALAEAFAGARLIGRGFTDAVTADGVWRRLAAEPVTAITAGPYAVDIDANGVGWVRAQGGGTVAVSYQAGLAASWDALPPALAQGVALLVQHLHEHREGDQAPPAAIAALWRPWRRVRIGSARR